MQNTSWVATIFDDKVRKSLRLTKLQLRRLNVIPVYVTSPEMALVLICKYSHYILCFNTPTNI